MMTTSEYRDSQYSRMWLGLGGFVALGTGIAVGAIYGSTVRVLVWIVLLVAVFAAVHRTRLDVVINADGVSLGAAHLPWAFVDRVEVLRGAAFRAALSTDAHPTDYLRIRSTNAGIRVWLADPTDPHRAWVASVKRPDDVTAALAVTA